MENYVLYDEIGRGSHSIVYKGRKKDTIEFVAIHCVEKYKRTELQNIVRLTHELDHENVVKFYEWYETTNHIWMVVELCTGDSLDSVLAQDKLFPEETVQRFGIELAKGLFYVHSLGILYCDLKPSRIMTDGAGILKLSDFALARVEGEDEFFDFRESDSDSDEEGDKYRGAENARSKRPKPSPYYMAPEVLQGGPHTKESDLWSFGCLLYELFTGNKPFVADSFPELVTKIFHEECPSLRQSTEDGFVNASVDLTDLVKRLLVKDPEQRINWAGIATHRFWGNTLDVLLKDGGEVEGVEFQDGILHLSEETSPLNVDEIAHKPSEQTKIVEKDSELEASDNRETLTAPEQAGIKQGTYTFSSRPRTTDSLLSCSKNDKFGETQMLGKGSRCNRKQDGFKTSSNKIQTKDITKAKEHDVSDANKNSAHVGTNPLAVKEKSKYSRQKTVVLKGRESSTSQSLSESHATDSESSITDLTYHPTDFLVAPIADNPRIKKFALAKWDPKALPCQALKAEEVLNLPEEKQVEHLSSILTMLSQTGKTGGGPVPSLQRSKLHTASYLASLCRDGEIANIIFESELIPGILKQIKSGFSADFKARLGEYEMIRISSSD